MHENFFERYGVEWKAYGWYLFALTNDFQHGFQMCENTGKSESITRTRCILCHDADTVELKIVSTENPDAAEIFFRCERCGWTKHWSMDNTTTCEDWNEQFINPKIFLKSDDGVKIEN